MKNANRLAITSLCIAVVSTVLGAVYLWVPIPGLNRVLEEGSVRGMKDAKNMYQIGQALMLYAQTHHGQYPPRLGDLILDADITPEVFVSPESDDTKAMGDTLEARATALESGGHESYIYIPNLNPSVDPRTVVLYEPLSHHGGAGMTVLYGDGHVEFALAKQAAGMIAELQAGFNPPRLGHY